MEVLISPALCHHKNLQTHGHRHHCCSRSDKNRKNKMKNDAENLKTAQVAREVKSEEGGTEKVRQCDQDAAAGGGTAGEK